jgi:hypothetical protein
MMNDAATKGRLVIQRTAGINKSKCRLTLSNEQQSLVSDAIAVLKLVVVVGISSGRT